MTSMCIYIGLFVNPSVRRELFLALYLKNNSQLPIVISTMAPLCNAVQPLSKAHRLIFIAPKR
jgi:hypothetical protein